jgi:two-component sensor histidine kinase
MLELKKERAELETLVDRALDNARPFVESRKQRIKVEIHAPVVASVDSTRLCQIVGNLLHNASKYAPTNGDIRLELGRDGDTAVVRVSDTGVGIPADQLERVFDMFARIERSVPSANTGLGIGLALSRQLAELHGGTLVASSEGEGKGATFTLRIPAIAAAPPPPAVSSGHGEPKRASNALRIVLIEDNDDAADTLAMWLEEMGTPSRSHAPVPTGSRSSARRGPTSCCATSACPAWTASRCAGA